MFSVFCEQIRNILCYISSKPSKLNFWNPLQQKIALSCRFLYKQPPDDQAYKCDTKCQSNSDCYYQHSLFGTKLRGGGSLFFINVGRFFQQERVLWSWMAGPSRNHCNLEKKAWIKTGALIGGPNPKIPKKLGKANNYIVLDTSQQSTSFWISWRVPQV